MELPTPAEPVDEGMSRHITPSPDSLVKLVLRTPKMNCTHDKAVEQTKNRFFCLDCGFEFKMVRQSALRRRSMIR